MEQQSVEDSYDRMENLDHSLANHCIQPSSPSEEIVGPVRYDYNTLESFYEIDVADFNMGLYQDQIFNDLLNNLQEGDHFSEIAPNGIIEDLNDLLTGRREDLHSTESNDIADTIQSTDVQLAMIKSSEPALPVTRLQIEKVQTKNVNDQSILLSRSVAVTVPTPNKLQLVYPLEETYRPRYKSDYFPQKGAVRRPRYVADSAGNHCISLQMPLVFSQDIQHAHIRIALITTSTNSKGHFYSPYKFQTNHDDVKVPDQNPFYLPVKLHLDADGIMRLHLVLIKSKLDQLNHAQPLKPFVNSISTIQSTSNEIKLSPKELIDRYQLDKSHIAFTLCTKLPNGTYEIHPETTVTSTVLSEVPPKPTTASKKKSEASTANPGKKVSCPNCAHCFEISEGDITEKGTKRKSNGGASNTNAKSTTANNRTTKKKKTVQ